VKKKGLDLEWEQEHLKEGRYTLDMVKIDRKHLQNKIEEPAPQVSVAT